MATQLDQARDVLARANRIIANEGVLDAFGHVSMRHPTDPGRYLLSRSRAPELVQPDDILEFTWHGATVAGVSLEELTFRTIYTARNAALQIQAHTLGLVSPLNLAETRLAGEYNLRPGPVMRAWEYWNARLDKVEGSGRPQVRKQAQKSLRPERQQNADAESVCYLRPAARMHAR